MLTLKVPLAATVGLVAGVTLVVSSAKKDSGALASPVPRTLRVVDVWPKPLPGSVMVGRCGLTTTLQIGLSPLSAAPPPDSELTSNRARSCWLPAPVSWTGNVKTP